MHLPSFSSLLQGAIDGGSGDMKELDNLYSWFSFVSCAKHPFSQILRIGFHVPSSHLAQSFCQPL
jgi:hypothetical protein